MASEHQVTLRSSLIGVNEPGSVETELLPKGRIILQAILEFDFQMGRTPTFGLCGILARCHRCAEFQASWVSQTLSPLLQEALLSVPPRPSGQPESAVICWPSQWNQDTLDTCPGGNKAESPHRRCLRGPDMQCGKEG